MARRPKSKLAGNSLPLEPVTGADAPFAVPLDSSPAPASDAAPAKRVSFPVKENGDIDWDGMRPTTAAELRGMFARAYQDAAFMETIGAKAAPVVNIFDEEWTGSLYDGLGAIESLVAQRMYNIPPDIAREVFTYTDAEKSKLAGPTAKVINKYATKYDFLVRFKEEIALGILLLAITSVKFKIASMRADMWRAQQKQLANVQQRVAAPVTEVESGTAPVQ